MALSKTLNGLVVELLDCSGIGVVLDATKQGKNLYKATIVCDNGDVIIAQFKNNSIKVGEDITYIDYFRYNPKEIAKLL